MLTFILIIIFISLLIRYLLPYLLPRILQSWVRKQQQNQYRRSENRQNSEDSVNIKYKEQGNKGRKPRFTGGEYIDYEEIENK